MELIQFHRRDSIGQQQLKFACIIEFIPDDQNFSAVPPLQSPDLSLDITLPIYSLEPEYSFSKPAANPNAPN